MKQHNYDEAKQITSQAIRDIEKHIKSAIENHTDLISQDGLNKTKLLNKVNMIRQNDSVVRAIKTLSSSDANTFNQSYQNALNEIDQTVEKQKQNLADALATIETAIDKIQSIALKARESVLIGEQSKSKQYISEMNSHAQSQDVKKALNILKWQKPNVLSNAVRDSIIEIKQYAKRQQDEADKQTLKKQILTAEAEKVVEQYTKDINALKRIIEKSDFLGKTDDKKLILDQLNQLVRDEKLHQAVQELGLSKTKRTSWNRECSPRCYHSDKNRNKKTNQTISTTSCT